MKDNRKLIIMFAILLVASFSLSLAYFTSNVRTTGEGNSTTATTTTVRGTNVSVEGKLEIDDADIYPGHRNLAMIKVTGTSVKDTELVAYNVIWSGTNELSTPLNYNIYKVDSEKNVSVTCTKTSEKMGTSKIYYETCEETNFNTLGSIVSSGTISGNKETILTDEFINATTSGTVVYYYLVLEYPNLNDSQNEDMGKSFEGELSIEKSDAKDVPSANFSIASSTQGSNNWYTSLSLNVNGVNEHLASGITSISYCITTNETCTPNINITGSSTIVPLTSNSNSQKVCANATSSHNITSDVTCSDAYLVDSETPSIAYSINSSTEGDNGWYKTLSIKVEGTSNNSSISSINYCITTDSTCTPNQELNSASTNVGLPNNSNSQKICAKSTNQAGTTGDVLCSSSYSVDNESPIASITSTSSTHNTITVNVTGNDTHSGVLTYYYSINNGLYQPSNDSSYVFDNLSAGATYTIKAYVKDTAGNISSEAITTANTKPTGAITISSSTAGSNSWYKALTLSISGTSESNITSIDYCITTSDTCTPNNQVLNASTTVTLESNENAQKVCATLTNSNGSTSELKCSNSYLVDTETPSLSVSVASSTTGSNSWYKAISIKADGNDSHSQVSSMKYCTTTSSTCTPTTAYTSGSSIALDNNASAQKVCFNVTDNAGWTSDTSCSSTYSVDGQEPGISITSTSSTGANATITVSGSDAHSGVSSYNYKQDTGSYTNSSNNSYTFSSLSSNNYTLYATTTDTAGNTSTTPASVTIYKVTASVSGGSASPSVKYAASGGSVTFTISASSGYNLSGATVSGTGCSLSSNKATLTASSVTAARTCTVTIPQAGKSVSDIVASATAGSTSITGVVTSNNGIKYVSDGMYGGTTYYYRGAVNNNWVKFAGMYWRIIRFNGDGSIRMIYSGTTAPTSSTATVMTGTGTQTTSKAYNSNDNDAIYVGFKYTSNNGHGTSTWSTIADYLVGTGSGGWYSSSGLSSYASYIADGKFCNDRTTNGSYFSGYTSTTGYGTSNTAFAPATRVYTSSWGANSTQTISTSCTNSSDIFTTKVGLITSDEVLMAGGKTGTGNSSYYLYTGQNYWTMSPLYFNGVRSFVFVVWSGGELDCDYLVQTFGVRPVINLKAGTKFKTTTNGTYSAPYEVM